MRKPTALHKGERNVGKGMVAGLIGGLTAAWVMGRFMSLSSSLMEEKGDSREEQNAEERQQTEAATEQQEEGSPTIQTAQAVSRTVFRHELREQEKAPAGEAVHYAFGGSVGAAYGATAEVIPAITAGAGLPFGAAVWLSADEMVLPALGLSEPRTEMPPAIHMSTLAAHFIYGLSTEFVRQAIRRRW